MRKIFYAALALTAAMLPASARILVFVGSSYTAGADSAVRYYQAGSVRDLNPPNQRGQTIGGEAALFKEMTMEAGLNYDVSIEALGSQNFDFHYNKRRDVLDRAWDDVVLQSISQIDEDKPGDPSLVIAYSQKFDKMFHARNPKARLWLQSTWSRADFSSAEIARWKSKPIDAMGKDLYAGFEKAKAAAPGIAGIIPVGLAWNRAWATGVADSDPSDGIAPGKLDLWGWDFGHGSDAGYLLATLVIFGQVTGHDPLSLGDKENAAMDLGLSPAQTHALEQVAHDELAAHGVKFGG